ncbi:DegT/DnrJ/EryC1/StrS family aminotransferase [Shinella zoogloeoides]|uniref:Aminotransferase class I/II-fold pyridoxal phosphate-dependent enzyme n=1 Tax=Shinella zoogloeoides TaxID=352475 RepID=A0A6N8THH4_SHIZO|nr:DegT/DnrJ/EryC1/StrS family aminotransferase [Shinella zoogloeoides]MXO02717.1 aminotransferase class I/II-fold pyridoxal phosphate-dependent enzyme [Shinella zoogloeoides]UEX81833.1 DegT/DnrJ/EryC1/StrS family aminotransferase [Shinella zoogloeoides]
MSVAFIDLKAQAAALGSRIPDAVARVLEHGAYISGPEVRTFEERLAAFCGARHAISCANGTDALSLALMAEGVGAGDAVFVPAFTFVATAEVAPLAGATPVFVDVREDTFNMDVDSLAAAVAEASRLGLNPRAVIPVDLFGLPADYDAINEFAASHGLIVIADSAQGFGGRYKGRFAGALGHYTTTSFFPAKPLGCYGDGGAILTDNDEKAALLRSIAVHGKGTDKYDNVRVGVNSRLDTMQAAILIEKLAIFPDEIVARDRVAVRYTQELANVIKTPVVPDGLSSVWAQYTIRVAEREKFAAHMKEAGIPTAVYYPIPMHRQTGYRQYPVAPGGLPISDKLAREVISLPMHPYLDTDTQDRIISAARAFCFQVA